MGLLEDLKPQLEAMEKELRKMAELELEKLINEKGDEAAAQVIAMLKAELPPLGDYVVDLLAPQVLAILKKALLAQVEKISDEV